jgi:ParB/RepB/Spo0J family partition protein
MDNRFREDFGDMLELIDSVRNFGILQPIAVSVRSDGRFKLLDGGRRIKACNELKLPRIPAFILDKDFDELTERQVELETNIQRKDFSFDERNKLVAKIHNLMQEKHGKKTSKAADAKGWTMDDTAKKLGKSRAFVSNALEMDEALKLMPELADAKNEHDARKQFKQAEKALVRELMMTEIKEKRKLSPIDQQRIAIEEMYQIGDWNSLPAPQGGGGGGGASLDLVEIDWPFAIDLQDHMEEYKEIKKEDYLPMIDRVLTQAKRVLKSTGWLIVWYAAEPWAEPIFKAIQSRGLRCRRLPGIWIKTQGETKRPEYYMSTNYEMFYYAGMSEATIVRRGHSNIFDQSVVPSQFKIHRTQKPVTLYDDIFSTFVMPNTQGCVFFAGSGNALLSFTNQGIAGFGLDINEEYKKWFGMNVHKGTPGAYLGWET